MLLAFADGRPFATGAAHYPYQGIGEQDNSLRVIVPVEIEGQRALAVVDTGAPYLVCAPQIASQLALDPNASLDSLRMLIRGIWYSGRLYLLNLTLLAIEGYSLELSATAFVPDSEWAESWGHLPSFLGLPGCLERLRFAVDPSTDTFYFGPLI